MNTSHYYIENQYGARLALTADESPFYLTNVSGLGIDSDNSFADVGQGFFSNTDVKIPRQKIVGDLIFFKPAFENYTEVVNFLESATSLYFVYKPYGNNEYYREVMLNTLEKAQRTAFGTMASKITLDSLTPWYLSRQTKIELVSGATNTTRYDIVYSDELRYATSAAGDATAEVSAVGHIPAAIVLTWRGAISNPVIRLTGVSGKEYGKVVVNGLFQSTDEIELSTRYENAYIVKRSLGGTETDLINSIDITTNPFFHIPVSEPCIVRMTAADVFSGRATIKVYNYHRSI